MAPEEAWRYAASWGSYIRNGDPGACLYGFSEDFKVQSEAHRTACLAQMVERRAYVEAHPAHYEPDELDQMDAFEAALRQAACS